MILDFHKNNYFCNLFDKSKEKIFHSSPDTWQNLGNMKFIDNVQSFYFDRQAFQDMRNTSVVWKEPVPINEAIKINIWNGIIIDCVSF